VGLVPWSTSDRKQRLPRNWRAIRKRVLTRDGYVCQIRGPACTVTATDVDHVIRGDYHGLDNLRAACTTCHRAKSSAEGHASRLRVKPRIEEHPGLIKHRP